MLLPETYAAIPARAARLSELEAHAKQVEKRAEGRAIAIEVAAIHAHAAAEARIHGQTAG
ncbi:hypothetical protein [Streptomyces sp. NPDC097640]|uniref:hypothetical protein n=1 Tax=Streptomyces sp. NPDC097640 TaxID=3157229 RepID=UPI00331DA13C